jgi:hypothetical protein
MNEQEWEVGRHCHHAQIEEEVAIVGAVSIKNQHNGAGIVRRLPPLLDLGMKFWTTVLFRNQPSVFE